MSKVKVSVVMPVYNAEEYLNVAYESGLKVAGYNLEELTRKKANASEFRIKNRDK